MTVRTDHLGFVDLLARGRLARALALATRAHAGQSRKHGAPYIEHPVRVARRLWAHRAPAGADLDLVAAGLLHDVVEDSGVTLPALRREFGARVAGLVEAVTRPRGVPKERYLGHLREAPGDVLALKIADRTDNLEDLVRQDDAAFGRRYLQETRVYLAPLAPRVPEGLQAEFRQALAVVERRFGGRAGRG